jgi:pimeloyl-ACP methyl ester carboxylesterase
MGALRNELHLAALDLPGFGWSPPPPDRNYSLASSARVVARAIEALADGQVHLVGNSLGGAVTTLVAAERPDLVRTLTLVAPALPVLRPRTSNAHLPALAAPWLGQRLARRLGRFPVEQRVRATLALCFADPTCVPPQRVEEAIAEASRRARLEHDGDAVLASLRGLLSSYLVRGPRSLWRAAARVQAPTLLIYGQRDRLVDPRSALRAARTFPNARLLVIPNSGHLAQVEHPQQVAVAIRRLVRSTTPPS